jgi:tetratricopeptide (TPR) repeat protein
LLKRALELVQPDSPEAAILLAEYAGHSAVESGDRPELDVMARRAIEIARKSGNLQLELRILTGSWALGDVREHTARWSDRILELARILDDKEAEFRGTWNLLFDLVVEGKKEELLQYTPRMMSLATSSRRKDRMFTAHIGAASLAMRVGDWVGARRYCDESIATNNTHPHIWGSRACSEFLSGDVAAGEKYLGMMVDAMKLATPGPSHYYVAPGVIMPLAAHITGDRSKLAYARQVCEAATHSTSHRALLGHLGLGLVAAELGDRQSAKSAYEKVVQSGPYLFVATYIDRQRALGMIANAADMQEEAASHFEESISFTRRAGFKPDLAWGCYDYGEMLVSHGTPTNSERAAKLRDEALSIARELGMKPLIERILRRREILKA